ncbi:bifunctional homocysteine S-methyltransferase/methylenetetrahydrofolate reductase [Amycolatopsis rhizosphaerae]|uniref:Bifunctional homocysteine S-methyltransferase/methylenetetrahydrofolate reductase n=1 Tax=Amycolatopsis rhizosphaerae TaxID=2053003 RepID=A0A558CPL2_9PSEU|nr:homocysteine S-methyltransferase family protein [Amycolatopsis rhizosphaerae]TVT50695.1 bifunctional homocysteine S-methyltransferase/methylenetetrahydrofolate reductase [Amycolatopsis rhizosphaerae]
MDFAKSVRDRVLVCDGAMGTMLHTAGNSLDRALSELNLSNPELVSMVHEAYVAAGADILLTNTFGANRLRLAGQGCSAAVRDVNLAGVRLARQARRGAGRPVFVGGSVSPAASVGQRGSVRSGERAEVIGEQVRALVDGGVDLLVLETFGYLDELVEAVEVAASLADVPILAQATFTEAGETLGGETVGEVARALESMPVAALGANCTAGPQHMLAIVEDFRRHTVLPVGVQPNAGLPRRRGTRFEYIVDGEYFGRYGRRYVEQGASIVGGCCGTTPAHLRALTRALADLRPVEPVRAQPARRTVAVPRHGVLARHLAEKDFVVAAEFTGETDDVTGLHEADLLFLGPAVSVNEALELARKAGIETVATVAAWDRAITTLQADLLGAHAAGLRTLVCETGAPPPRGEYPRGGWEVDSLGLIELLAGLNAGRDHNGHTLAIRTSFHIGARFNPGAHDVDAELARTRAKIAAGAHFLVTRPVYELDRLTGMLAELSEEDIPVLVTVSPLTGYAEAEYLTHEVPDVTIPRAALAALENTAHGPETGLALAADLVARARETVQGVVIRARGGMPRSLLRA